MRSTTVSRLRATLSDYLARVKAGEEVIVIERGKAIAKIVPIGRDQVGVPAHLLEMARAGLVRLGSGKLPKGFWKMPRPADPTGAVLKALLEERGQRTPEERHGGRTPAAARAIHAGGPVRRSSTSRRSFRPARSVPGAKNTKSRSIRRWQ